MHTLPTLLLRKLSEGVEETIRPCVGTLIVHGGSCIHNPAIGREDILPHVIEEADTPKGSRLLVLGLVVWKLHALLQNVVIP